MVALTALTPEVAAALEGPGWMQRRRQEAAERFVAAELPSIEEEVWRYSRVGELELDRYHLPGREPGGAAQLPPAVEEVLSSVGERSGLVVLRNGTPEIVELDERLASKGVRLGPQGRLDRQEPEPAGERPSHRDLFTELNEAFAAGPILLEVPAGVAVEAPVVVASWIDAEGSLVLPRTVVRGGAGSEVRLLDWVGSPDGIDLLSVPLVQIELAGSARLGYCALQVLGDAAWQVGSQVAVVGEGASLRSFAAGFGGAYARLRTDCVLAGRRATGDLSAAYFGTGSQSLDFRTFQDHAAPDTTSTLLFKGAVDDRSRSVYTGTIHVRPEARGADAVQTNRNVKLSGEAWAESVPNLVIENNEVRCSHASTVGPVDEDQLFYLESRGVPPEVAERLIVGGFFDEVLAELPVREAAGLVRAQIARALAAGGAR